MKLRHLTNRDVPMPPEYEEMMQHYLPANTPKAVIVDAWKHNATPTEVMRHLERIEGQARSKTPQSSGN